jgi:hypothetical protein
MVMATRCRRPKSAEPAKYLPVLKIKYKGVTGTIQFDQNGDIKDGALTLFTYKGGKISRSRRPCSPTTPAARTSPAPRACSAAPALPGRAAARDFLVRHVQLDQQLHARRW